MRSPGRVLFALLVAATFAATAGADSPPSAVEARAAPVRHWFVGLDMGTLSFVGERSRSMLGPRTGLQLGLVGGYRFTRWLELEAAVRASVAGNKLNQPASHWDPPPLTLLSLGARAFLAPGPVAPFVDGHLGFGEISTACPRFAPAAPGTMPLDCVEFVNSYVMYGIGIGVEWTATPWLAITSSLRVTRASILGAQTEEVPPEGVAPAPTSRDDARSWLSMVAGAKVRF